MNSKLIPQFFVSSVLLVTATMFAQTMFAQTMFAQATGGPASPQYSTQGKATSAAAPQGTAVSYAAVTQVNGLLSQIEASSKGTQAGLAKLRVERWKTDGSTKKQSLADVDSIQRNLQDALPEMIAQVRNAPDDLSATFRLYRNLEALYSVLSGLVESAGAFGPKDDFQAMSDNLSGFEVERKQLASRIEDLATSKEQEIVRLRSDLKTARAAVPAAPPKKTVVDDNEAPKKPVAKKKPAPKKPATPPPATTPPTASTPPAQNPPQ